MKGRSILEASEVGQCAVQWRRETRVLSADVVMLPTDQPLGALAVYLCEPESDDGVLENGLIPMPALGDELNLWRVVD